MSRRPFHDRTRPPPVYRALRVFTLVVVVFWVPLAAFSGFRAIVQVYDLEIHVTSPALVPGTVVQADVVTSGRAHADVVLELRQRSTVDTIGGVFVSGNRDGAFDPRARRASLRVILTREQLAHLMPGPATLRAVAVGRHQWMRLPPPTVRELSTTIAP